MAGIGACLPTSGSGKCERAPGGNNRRGSCGPRLPSRVGCAQPSASVPAVDSYLVITNQGAGTADQERLQRALDVLTERASVEVASTSHPGELDGVLHRAGSRRIVVAGGDGSLHVVVAALHRRNELSGATLGLIPLGTGNDCAQASRRGHRWKHRLGAVGVGKVNLGKLGYPIGAMLAAFKPPQLRLRIVVDGEVVVDVDDPVLMMAVGNSTSVGGGTELTPRADAEDGKVDVMISRSISLPAKLGYAAGLARGNHHHRDDVLYLRAREVSVTGDAFYSAADGELSGPERQRTWRVEPSAYRMVLPEPRR